MEVRDVTMLGFVKAAEEYIAKNSLKGTELGDLKNIDIVKLKNDLSEQLKVLSISDDYKEALIKVGEKAFDEYAKENLKTKNVMDELGEIFSLDVDEEFGEVEEIDNDENEEIINNLLAAYDVDEQEEKSDEESLEFVEDDNNEEPIDQETNEINEETENDFGLSDDDNILTTIANAAAKSDEELERTFKDVIQNEENTETNIDLHEEDVQEQKVEEVVQETKTDEINAEEKIEAKIDEAIQEEKIEEVVQEEAKTKDIEIVDDNSNQNSDLSKNKEVYNIEKEETTVTFPETIKPDHVPLSFELKKIKRKSEMEMPIESLHVNKEDNKEIEETKEAIQVEETKEVEEKEEQTIVEEPTEPLTARILTNPALDYVIEYENYANGSFYEVDNRIVGVDDEIDNHIDTIVTNPGIEEKSYDSKTLSSIISSLDDLREKKENRALIEEEYKENNEIYDNIINAYPYLNKDFIRTIFSQKEEIEDSYEENKDYILLHRIRFSDVEELHEFVEIMVEHKYEINVDEKQMIVDTFGEIVNEDGVILTNILGIANQAKILNGMYDGYCVIGKDTI